MEQYTTTNSILMLKCFPLNWEVVKTYKKVFDDEKNPEIYVINIGSLSDMWQVSLRPDTMIVSFTSLHYSNHEVYRFKVDEIEDASKLALNFAIGMDQLDNLKNTIYWNGN